MTKFKKATKRITAVASSALLVSSAVFGAGLGDYPSNFVQNGKFNGQIVVGASAAAMDTTAAVSIIDDLKNEFSGANEKVKITYRSTSSGGDSVDAIKNSNLLNYGETIGATTETNGFDDSDTDFLQDEDFDNGISDEDYEQTLTLAGGEFNYALRDEVDGVEEIAHGIFYNNDDTFATYTLDLDNAINLSSSSNLDDDMVGRDLMIMGNEFTIGSITASSGELNKLELLGGANKVSLGEGESTSVTINGNPYEVSVQSVSSTKVLLTVNGESKSIDEYDTEDIAGISVAVTDIVDSSRDLVKGYAEIVVGGQKVTLEDGSTLVKVNDDDVDDLFEDYEVFADFSDGGTMDTITITYKVADDVLLEKGDSLQDVLFESFEVVFDGVNDVEWETVKFTVNDDDVEVQGTTINGKDLNRELIHTTTTSSTGANGATYLVGKQDTDRIFTSESVYFATSVGNADDTNDGTNGFTAINTSGGTGFTAGAAITNVTLNFSKTAMDGSGILLFDDDDDQYLYEIESVDTNNADVDVEEFLDGKNKDELTTAEFITDLEKALTGASSSSPIVNLPLSALGTAEIGFAGELMVRVGSVENATGATGGFMEFSYDDDIDGDDTTDENELWNITLGWDTSDEEFNLVVSSSDSDFVNSNDADNVEGDTDVKTYVTVYGTHIEYDNDENEWVHVMVPDEQIFGEVSIVFGGAASTEATVTVDADQADAKEEELKDDGMTIVSTETVTSDEVEFDVTAPVTDSDVSGWNDMIVVGGPAVNSVARSLLGVETYDMSQAGVSAGEAVIQHFEDSNAVLVYGYAAEDTMAAAEKLNEGGLTGTLVNVE